MFDGYCILGELVTPLTHFPPLILPSWMLSPAVLTSTHTECVADEWWRRRASWEMEWKPYKASAASRRRQGHDFAPELTLPVLSFFVRRPLYQSFGLQWGSAWRGSCVSSVQSVWMLANPLQPCKYHTGCVRRGEQACKMEGLKDWERRGGWGRGREKEPAQLLNLERMKRALAGVLRD